MTIAMTTITPPTTTKQPALIIPTPGLPTQAASTPAPTQARPPLVKAAVENADALATRRSTATTSTATAVPTEPTTTHQALTYLLLVHIPPAPVALQLHLLHHRHQRPSANSLRSRRPFAPTYYHNVRRLRPIRQATLASESLSIDA